ncbi:hydrogenase iron-sulfur subunit [Halogranum rubrum]|uniref:Iron-sulfur binding protein, ferredoxin-like protein n=1 Tax=Halogranum salarium B-1 TaxID=1210908 RepID=J2ZEW2_9EURY|nr:hydrogenase iron-sulfur subunit [Halogranum salarium]EJN59210.1 iron-sulfur binding protein, ferredoxin-like protein [Halogranum salarium B-1]
MNVGAFVCSCGGTCDLDLEGVRDGVRDVDVVASSELLCQDGLDAVGALVDEYELDQIIATATDDGCQRRIETLAEEKGLHPEATAFVDHRERTSWVHSADESTDKTARLINATTAGLQEEASSRYVSQTTGDRVAVVGDPETAAALADTADVTLVAHGHDFAGVSGLDDVAIERGRVVGVDGEFGEFTLTLEALVTEDCISCMECVEQGPDGAVTARPVDISPNAPDGEWLDCCPTEAIDASGVQRTVEVDQVVYPGATDGARGGRIGFYTGPVDAATVASVEHHLGGVEKPKFLDLEMDVCAAGESSQEGCTVCVDACPHDAVDRPKVDEVEFDEVACMNCGACTSSCPTGAVQLREPSNRRIAREVEALLDAEERGGGWLFDRETAGIETPVVAFVCSEYAADALREYGRQSAAGADLSYAPILPVRVNCTDTVGEAHALHALAAGADGVAIVGCGSSCLHSGPDPKAELVDRLGRATTDLGLGERVTFLAPEADDPSAFVDELDEFVGGLEATPVPAGDYESTGVVREEKPNPEYNNHDWTLESIRTIVEHSSPERDVIRGLQNFGRMDVSDACNLTPTCSTLCPTDAIRRTDDGDLQFNHEDCVNCELCEEGCPETAITMEAGLDLSLLPENRDGERWSTVYEGEMLECARCGKPFTSQGSAEKVMDDVGHLVEGIAPQSDHSIFEYCGECRATLMFEQGGQ